ncbi:beta-galactosidase [Prevotella sp. P5-92]|uniref:DUF4982 domain-containing protein n=1 Tax=Prevotella sp. P5-92 TaxID=2024222 RepID=UPI000B9684A8|nr:DUF4982 domain-containing protein [Prevotella sp. P5-92]OYP55060.1 beta-galactosidase [Prevotella sp. P5-92]
MRNKMTLMALAVAALANSQPRRVINLTDGWQFSRDNNHWESVSVPHDWAIAGPFDKKWDLQYVAIEQNGETEKSEKSGRSGALPWIGQGFYRTTVTIPDGYSRATLMIDGAMSNARVKVGGKQLAYWPYGYNAFNVDIPVSQTGNTLDIEVSLDNVEESSRWYPGGGIYRPVRLLLTGENHFPVWQTYIRTLTASTEKAIVEVVAKAQGEKGNTIAVLRDHDGRVVAEASEDDVNDAVLQLAVANPRLWSPESPYLYTLTLSRLVGGKKVDEESHKVGIRTISVSKDGGFRLNGVSRKIKGVCLHHDLGPLGAAENKAAVIRQIKMMKAMGCDAIRTAHNMPSTLQMEVCDSLGMMVMAESFDMWIYPKCKNGYAKFFKEWADRDIENLVLHHRNHPSIVMWSIGNEIPEQWSKEGVEISRHLQSLCHRLDPSRPVTQGMDRAEAALKSGFAQVMDVPGFNYRVHKYEKNIAQLPQGFLLGSETASTVSSRGVYKFPVVVSDNAVYDDGQCSSYDTEYCSWSNLPDDDWRCQDDYPWVIGEFVWTGYDYLGEPTPYDTYWPSRSSYFGICDLAGLPKDRYYLYRSRWNTATHTIHLLPHWTWPGREGELTPVYCYTDAPEAELFVNGKSQGRISKRQDSRLDRYRLRWNDVTYQPGELRVVAYNADGSVMGEQKVLTAGKPVALRMDVECPSSDHTTFKADGATLKADHATLKADGADLAFITVSLEDANGTFCPTLSDDITIEVTGEGVFEAACNGDATSLQSMRQPTMKLFSGKAVFVVRSTTQSGTIQVTATDKLRRLKRSISITTK